MRLNFLITLFSTAAILTGCQSETEEGTYHIVEKGETLYEIAQHYEVGVADVKNWNQLPDNRVGLSDTPLIKKKKP